MDEDISLNPAEKPVEERIHQKALEILEPCRRRDRENDINSYYRSAESGRSSCEPGKVAAAAHNGRVGTLLLNTDCNPESGHNTLAEELDNEGNIISKNEDLYNLAAVYSLRSNARICPLSSDQMPNKESLAAVYRY